MAEDRRNTHFLEFMRSAFSFLPVLQDVPAIKVTLLTLDGLCFWTRVGGELLLATHVQLHAILLAMHAYGCCCLSRSFIVQAVVKI